MKVFLAGDSLVQDYTPEEFIAGWGQYLGRFFDENTEIVNDAKGGRSSRLFINEGRFDKIAQEIGKGDYLLIEFCHNDDASKTYHTMFNRLVELGEPDKEGRYPLIPGEKMPKDYIPPEYLKCLMEDEAITNKEAVLKSIKEMFAAYPGEGYYPYSAKGEKGSYKWFLKQFVDMARQKGAIPVFVTAPARAVFDENGHIKDGAALHGGDHFCYIRAMQQLAEEADVPVIDLFSYSCTLFESIGKEKIHMLTSIKSGNQKGKWPEDFESELQKKETISEDTHMNKYGAYLLAKGIIELLTASEDSQLAALKAHLRKDHSAVLEKAPEGLRTAVYFVRHAQPDHNHKDDKTRPLTAEGKEDCKSVLAFFKERKIDAFYCSPYKRSIDTIQETARYFGKAIHTDDRLREREKGPDGNHYGMFQKRWADHSYHEEGGESIDMVQERNIAALKEILMQNIGKNIVIGTHGTALSSILNYYDRNYDCDAFLRMIDWMPYIIELDFEDIHLTGLKEHLHIEKEFKGKARADQKQRF